MRWYYEFILAVSIAWFEGWFQPNSKARRHNNPGNLRHWIDTPVVNGYAVFPTPIDGFRALFRQIQKNISRGLTLREFFQGKEGVYPGYAPIADGNPSIYADFVASKTGIPLDNESINDFIVRRSLETGTFYVK